MPLFSGQSLGGQWRKWILGAVKDLFNRSNTASSLGSADTGQPWTNTRGTWFINNNKAQSNTAASSYPLASVQAGLMTPYLKADVDTQGGAGLAFWVSDTQNWYGVFGQTNTNTTYSQVCSAYSQTGPTYSCPGSINTTYSPVCSNTQTNYTASCSNTQTNYSPSCSNVQTNYTPSCNNPVQQYATVCNSASGPSYTSVCIGWTQTSNFVCVSFTVRYDGFRGYWYVGCNGYGTTYGSSCNSWTSSAPTWTCTGGYSVVANGYSCGGSWSPSVSGYSCIGSWSPQVSGYSCIGSWSPSVSGYSCIGTWSQQTNYSCSVSVVGPTYASTCASYTQTSANNAGSTTLRIVKSAANVVSTLVDQVIAQLPASIQVFFNGNQIVARAYSGAGQTSQIGSDITYTDASPAKSTVHGIILAPGGYYQGTTVDNFSANTVQ
jgi:hypothetical protein